MAVRFYADPKLAKDSEQDKCLANVKSKAPLAFEIGKPLIPKRVVK